MLKGNEEYWNKHVYHQVDKNGKRPKRIKKWFGSELLLIVDAKHELSFGFTISNDPAY